MITGLLPRENCLQCCNECDSDCEWAEWVCDMRDEACDFAEDFRDLRRECPQLRNECGDSIERLQRCNSSFAPAHEQADNRSKPKVVRPILTAIGAVGSAAVVGYVARKAWQANRPTVGANDNKVKELELPTFVGVGKR